jgi:hypothetical protein
MSVCILPDRTLGLVAGFVANQPNLLSPGWSVRRLSQRLRALNELAFHERYPQAAIDRAWSECPDVVLGASLPQVFRALQDVVYNSNLAADRETALFVSSILGRAIELLPEGAGRTGSQEHEVFPA